MRHGWPSPTPRASTARTPRRTRSAAIPCTSIRASPRSACAALDAQRRERHGVRGRPAPSGRRRDPGGTPGARRARSPRPRRRRARPGRTSPSRAGWPRATTALAAMRRLDAARPRRDRGRRRRAPSGCRRGTARAARVEGVAGQRRAARRRATAMSARRRAVGARRGGAAAAPRRSRRRADREQGQDPPENPHDITHPSSGIVGACSDGAPRQRRRPAARPRVADRPVRREHGESEEPTQHAATGTRLDPWVDAYADRTRGLTASAGPGPVRGRLAARGRLPRRRDALRVGAAARRHRRHRRPADPRPRRRGAAVRLGPGRRRRCASRSSR